MNPLYSLLEFPSAVIKLLDNYESQRKMEVPQELKQRLLRRETWVDAVEELKQLVGFDPMGIGILWELLQFAEDARVKYRQKGIEEKIFVDTMKFCTRFLNSYYQTYGEYAFEWAHWFPRQLSLSEFRLGTLEYEYKEENGGKGIWIHIPSDADLSLEAIQQSYLDARSFFQKHFPDWANLDFYCSSWLLSPALKALLDPKSKILGFQKFFEILEEDPENLSVLRWVFPKQKEVSEALDEETSLQKKAKAYLLSGGKIGTAKGVFRLTNK